MADDSTFNFEVAAAATEARIDAIPYARSADDPTRRDIVEHQLRVAFNAGYQARVKAEESNLMVWLDVNEGEADPLDEAASRCFATAVSGMSELDAKAAIREELRQAFGAGRKVSVGAPFEMPATKPARPLANTPLSGVDPDVEKLATLLEHRAAYDIETARRLREML
jgi:outer membrane cobalamin receptor